MNIHPPSQKKINALVTPLMLSIVKTISIPMIRLEILEIFQQKPCFEDIVCRVLGKD